MPAFSLIFSRWHKFWLITDITALVSLGSPNFSHMQLSDGCNQMQWEVNCVGNETCLKLEMQDVDRPYPKSRALFRRIIYPRTARYYFCLKYFASSLSFL